MTIYFISILVAIGLPMMAKVYWKNLSSISETYYRLGKYRGIFTTWAMAVAFLLFPLWLESSPEGLQFITFLSVVGLGVVGFAPRFKTSQFWQHTIGAICCMGLGLLWTLCLGLWWIFAIGVILGVVASILWGKKYDTSIINPTSWIDKLMAKYKVNDLVFWIEIGAFLSIIASIGIKIF